MSIFIFQTLGTHLPEEPKKVATIRRSQKRPALLLLRRVSSDAVQALNRSFNFSYTFFVKGKHWRLVGKEVKGHFYFGLLDKRKAELMLDRLDEGTPLEELLNLDNMGV